MPFSEQNDLGRVDPISSLLKSIILLLNYLRKMLLAYLWLCSVVAFKVVISGLKKLNHSLQKIKSVRLIAFMVMVRGRGRVWVGVHKRYFEQRLRNTR